MSARPRYLMATALVLLISIAVQMGCAEHDKAQTQQTIRLGLVMQITSALIMVALDRGYLTDEGFNVVVTPYPSGARALNDGLFKDVVDISSASDLPITLANLAQKPAMIVATIGRASNANRIVARRNAGIAQAADLRGKRIATQKASAVHFFLHRFLLHHDLSAQDIKPSFMPAEQLPGALFNGEIDAFSMREPYIGQAKKLLGDQAIIFEAPGIYEQTDMLIVHKDYLKAHPTIVRPLLRALLKAEDFIAKHPGEAIALVAQRMKISTDELKNIWPSVVFQIGLQQSSLLLMESQARWAITEKLTSATAIPNLLDSIRLDELQALKPLTMSVIH